MRVINETERSQAVVIARCWGGHVGSGCGRRRASRGQHWLDKKIEFVRIAAACAVAVDGVKRENIRSIDQLGQKPRKIKCHHVV